MWTNAWKNVAWNISNAGLMVSSCCPSFLGRIWCWEVEMIIARSISSPSAKLGKKKSPKMSTTAAIQCLSPKKWQLLLQQVLNHKNISITQILNHIFWNSIVQWSHFAALLRWVSANQQSCTNRCSIHQWWLLSKMTLRFFLTVLLAQKQLQCYMNL